MKKKILRIGMCLFLLTCLAGCTGGSGEHSSANPFSIKTESSGQIFAMDTYMKIDAYGENADAAIHEALDLIQALDQKWSATNPQSEVALLNEAGQVTASTETEELFQVAYSVYESTDGALDITIYPLVRLWGFPTQDYHVPSKEEINEVLPLINMSGVSLDSSTHTLSVPNQMQIDFGAVAKGYTAEKIIQLFRGQGIESALVTLGGNIQCLGYKKDQSEWRIGIQNPSGDTPLGILSIHDCAVVTSGDYQRYFEENGMKYHHILDPSTGYPADGGITSISILCTDGTKADALSTALFVLGKEAAIQYWQNHSEEFDFVMYTTKQELIITKGIEKKFTSSLPFSVIDP